MKKIILLCFSVLLFIGMIPGYALDSGQNEERFVLKENFKKLVPLSVSEQEIKRLESVGFPTENLKQMICPLGWFAATYGMPQDLKMTFCEQGWHISTEKTVCIVMPRVEKEFSDFSMRIALCGGHIPSTVSLLCARLGMLNDGQESCLKKIELAAGETQSVHIPIHFDPVNTGFQMFFKITGDVTLQSFEIGGTPMDMTGKGLTCVEGTLEACSAIPDPKKSDYPDCRFTCRFHGDNIQTGTPCPRDVQLAIDGFKNYKLLGTKTLKVGDKVRCIILPYEKLPENQKSTHQADDLDLFDLECFYVQQIEKINEFSENSIIPFSDVQEEYVSVFERKINPPLSEELENAQQAAIAEELKKINAMLADWNETKITAVNAEFQKAYEAEKAKDKPGYNRVKEGNRTFVWRNVDNSFWALPENYKLINQYQPIARENIAALVALRDFLHANGCQMIVSIVPDSSDISARVIMQKFRNIPDFYTAMTIQELLKNGIETFYPSDEIIRNYQRYPFAFLYPGDPHPADTCQDVLADLVAERLKRFHFLPNRDPRLFSIVPHHGYTSYEIKFPDSCDIGLNYPKMKYLCNCCLYDGNTFKSEPSSPVLVIGNSYIQTPMTLPESFPALLSSKIHMGLSTYRVAGSGLMTTIVQWIFRNPKKYLEKKNVVVVQLGTIHLHADYRFSNAREMDEMMRLLSGKKYYQQFEIHGNTKNATLYDSDKLIDAKIFTIPPDGELIVLLCDIPNDDTEKEKILVLPVCAIPATLKILVNGENIPFNYAHQHHLHWNKIVVRLPAYEKHIKIELKGKAGTTIAINNPQIYR